MYDTNYEKIIGYNPFIAPKQNNARLGRKIVQSERFYFEMLSLLAMSRFKWENIPIEIPEYQLEKCLFYSGMAGITFDDIAEKYVILPVIYTTDGLNMYGEPNKFKMFSYSNFVNYDNLELNKNGLICYNNILKESNLFLCYRYSQRLQMIDNIIDMNIDKQKSPYIILCKDKKEYLSLKNLLNKLDLDTPAIYETKELLEESVKTLDLKVELKSDDLLKAKREIYNEACLYLGISSSLSSKKERLISAEVDSETQRYEIYRQTALQTREYFCKQVKKMYNLDLQVKFSTLQNNEIDEAIIDTNINNRNEKVKKIKKEIKKDG